MKTFFGIVLCVVVVSAKSKLRNFVPNRQIRADEDPFTLSFGSPSGGAGGCQYKGQTYQEGQAWQDGCLYNCICQSAATGTYKCTDRCPTYADLPPVCALVTKPGECCGEPQCNFQTSGMTGTGSGTGTVTGGGTMTGGGTVTGTGTGTMTGGTMTGGVCVDKLTNCADYTKAVCSNHDYTKWVHDNCCAYCSGGTGGVMTITGGTDAPVVMSSCVDALPNCKDYTASVCLDASYDAWVTKNCPRFCNKCGTMTGGTGTMTGGTGTMTGGTGTMTGGTGTVTGGGTMTGGTGTGTGGTGTMTGGTGTMTGGTGTMTACVDVNPKCASYDKSICTDPHYDSWVSTNCLLWCGKCTAGTMVGTGGTMTGTGTGTGTFTGTGGTGTGTGTFTGTGGTGTGTGTGTFTGTGGTGSGTVQMGTCHDALPNCADYTQAVCTNADYATWVLKNCPLFCNKCGTMTGGTGTGTGGTMTGGGTGTVTGTGTGTMTGGTMTGTGTGTMTGGCVDVASNCALLNQQAHICTDAGAKVYAQQNCAMTCGLCGGTMVGGTGTGTSGGTMTGTGTMVGGGTGTGTGTGGTVMTGSGSCHDAIDNCKAYDPSVCTSADYKQWATQNCAGTCNLCAGASTFHTGGGGTVSGTMGGGTQGTGTMTGSSSGCVYNSHLYQQGETWKDGCKFSCQCVDGSTGKYQCTQLCVQWSLPPQCHMNPPAPGKCCTTPSCPAGFDIQYPTGYTEQ